MGFLFNQWRRFRLDVGGAILRQRMGVAGHRRPPLAHCRLRRAMVHLVIPPVRRRLSGRRGVRLHHASHARGAPLMHPLNPPTPAAYRNAPRQAEAWREGWTAGYHSAEAMRMELPAY